jgi:prolyl oligopeptidase
VGHPYPTTRRDDVTEVMHGETIADPYRWLEDTSSAETAEWVKLQNELTESVLSRLPARDAIRDRLTEVWDFPRQGVPFERGGRWFQLRNSGLQAQDVLFVMTSPTDEGRVLLDPNTLSADGTVALSSYEIRNDGRLMAYATSAAGSDWMTWQVREIDSGRDLPDRVEWSKFSGAGWTSAGDGFYYSKYDAPQAGRELLDENRTPRIMLHVLGTDQSEDQHIFSAPDQPEWIPGVSTTDDSRFLIVSISRGTFPETQLHVLDSQQPTAGLQPLVADFSCEACPAGNVGETFYLTTDDNAERRRVVAVDLKQPQKTAWREVVSETKDTLLSAQLLGGRIVANYLVDAHSALRVFALDGAAQHAVQLPHIVTVSAVTGHADVDVIHYGLTSFTDVGSIWRHDLGAERTERVSASPATVDADDVVTSQSFVTAADGARVPVFLLHRKDVVPSGDVPVLLYGYGGFNIPLTPAFSAMRMVWVERGGLAAVANLRGGGEYGRAWHDAGRLANKQNVFDDFCAVARWLGRESGWSRSDRIAIHGGSNGGLLVGACLTQHPELFGAAIPAVGVLDMLRFHKFTIGWAWTSDYGDPDDPMAFDWVRAYSPLHNIRPGTSYPATLALTGDHDDRVAPGHSFKFAAALQAAQSGDAPVLIRIESSGGHGAGKPTQKLIQESSDLLAFAEHALGV